MVLIKLSNTTCYLHAQEFLRERTASVAQPRLRCSLQQGMPLTPVPCMYERRLRPPGADPLVDYYVGELKDMDWVTRHEFLLSIDITVSCKIKMCMGEDELIDGKLGLWQSFLDTFRDPVIPIALPYVACQPVPDERGSPDPFTPGQKKITDFFKVVGINKSGVAKRPASVQPTLSMLMYKKAKKDDATC